MQFRTQQDVGAGIDQVFATVGDFSAIERQALRRHIEVVRTGPEGVPAKAAWRLTISVKGKPRVITAHVVQYDPPNGYSVQGTTEGLEIDTKVELIALSKTRTRLIVTIDVTPRSISARLVMSPLRLAKGKLEKRFHDVVAGYVQKIEDRKPI